MKNLTLDWIDFCRISNLSSPPKTGAGVYVWGFTINNEFVPYYVGIAEDIVFRMFEHLNAIIGGKYTIYHKDSLVNFIAFKGVKESVDQKTGKLYTPDWPKSYYHFLANRKTLQLHIDFMVDAFTFSFALIDKESISGADLKEIEKICIRQIGIDLLANTRGGHSDKFILEHGGNNTVCKIMRS